MRKNSFISSYDFLSGVCFFPLIPIFLYFLDFYSFQVLPLISMDYYNYIGLSCSLKSLNFYCYDFNRSIYFMATMMFPFMIAYSYWRTKCQFFNMNNVKFKQVLKIFLVTIFLLILLILFPFIHLEIGHSHSPSVLSSMARHEDPIIFILLIYMNVFFISFFSGVGLKFLVFYIRSFKNDMSCK